MALTISQRNEVLRHLRYPITGSPAVTAGGQPYTATFGQAGGLIGFRYFEFFPLLIYRLNNLSQEEEVALLGPGSSYFSSFVAVAKAQINITIGAATAGDSITAQINGTPAAYTVNNGDNALAIASGLATAINASTTLGGIVIASASASSGTQSTVVIAAKSPGFLANSLTLQAYTAGTSFTSATVTTFGTQTATLMLSGGQDPPGPVWTDPDQTVVQPYYGYVPIIRYWESQLTNAASGMDTIRADVFSQRQDELAARYGGYITWCKRLAQWAGVPYGGAGSYDGVGPTRRIS